MSNGENKGVKINTFNLIIGIIGALVTITASIGGSYVTTQVILARHDEKLKSHEIEILRNSETMLKQMELLNKIDKAVAVIEERTK